MTTKTKPKLPPAVTCTVEEAAARAGVSRAHYYNLVSRGEAPGIRRGRRILVPLNKLELWLADEPWA